MIDIKEIKVDIIGIKIDIKGIKVDKKEDQGWYFLACLKFILFA